MAQLVALTDTQNINKFKIICHTTKYNLFYKINEVDAEPATLHNLLISAEPENMYEN